MSALMTALIWSGRDRHCVTFAHFYRRCFCRGHGHHRTQAGAAPCGQSRAGWVPARPWPGGNRSCHLHGVATTRPLEKAWLTLQRLTLPLSLGTMLSGRPFHDLDMNATHSSPSVLSILFGTQMIGLVFSGVLAQYIGGREVFALCAAFQPRLTTPQCVFERWILLIDELVEP